METEFIYIDPQITPYLWSLTKAHAIWIRDNFSMQDTYMGVPWPVRNLYGIEQPISEFIGFFNFDFASNMMTSAENMNVYVLDELVKDCMQKGDEGFSFPIDCDLFNNLDKMKELTDKLKIRFPHLANV